MTGLEDEIEDLIERAKKDTIELLWVRSSARKSVSLLS